MQQQQQLIVIFFVQVLCYAICLPVRRVRLRGCSYVNDLHKSNHNVRVSKKKKKNLAKAAADKRKIQLAKNFSCNLYNERVYRDKTFRPYRKNDQEVHQSVGINPCKCTLLLSLSCSAFLCSTISLSTRMAKTKNLSAKERNAKEDMQIKCAQRGLISFFFSNIKAPFFSAAEPDDGL